MRIAVMGAGGMGGYFGGLLARAGEDVTLIARGAHLAALRDDGLTVKSTRSGAFVIPVKATDRVDEIGVVDLVLFCVKTYDLEFAAAQIRPLVGNQTLILPLQNGIDAGQRISALVGSGRVLGGISYVGAHIETPGVIYQGGVSGKLILGDLDGDNDAPLYDLLAVLRRAGIDAELHEQIALALWEKFILVCATGGVLALVRLPFGPAMACAETRQLMAGVMQEVESVALAQGVAIRPGTADRQFNYLLAQMDPTGRSSQLTDLLAGRRLELESLNGTVVRLGEANHLPVPLNFTIYAGLKPYVEGRAVTGDSYQ
jgi:2-dehydropantoate 2-reductase